MIVHASAASHRGVKAEFWRGVLDTVEQKTGALGPYTSGERIWRCDHEHRTESAALRCAQRAQDSRNQHAFNDFDRRLKVGRDHTVRTSKGRELGHVFHVYSNTWETSCTIDGCGWARDDRYQRDGVSELHMHHLANHRLAETSDR